MGSAEGDAGRPGPAPSGSAAGLATAAPEAPESGSNAPVTGAPEATSAAGAEPAAMSRPAPPLPSVTGSPLPAGDDLAESVRWVVMLRTVQLAALAVAGLAVLPLGLPEASRVLLYCTPVVLVGTAALFAVAAERDLSHRRLSPAWALFALALVGIAVTVLLRALLGDDRPD